MTEYQVPKGIEDAKKDKMAHMASHLLIVVGPSGTGKTTLLNHLLQMRPSSILSRSTTTRRPRGREQNGREYDFVDEATFERMIAADAFAEYARVFGHYYGTPHSMIEQNVETGHDVLFDIDVQGARNLKAQYTGAWCVLIAPPSMKVLEMRLRRRATDDEEVIERRLETAKKELSECGLFDFMIVNDGLETACAQLLSIYDALTLRAAR